MWHIQMKQRGGLAGYITQEFRYLLKLPVMLIPCQEEQSVQTYWKYRGRCGQKQKAVVMVYTPMKILQNSVWILRMPITM